MKKHPLLDLADRIMNDEKIEFGGLEGFLGKNSGSTYITIPVKKKKPKDPEASKHTGETA